MDGVAYLIKKAYVKDEIGQFREVEDTNIEILVSQKSINRAEMLSAGQIGFKPEIMLMTASANYNGEKDVLYNGKAYSVYRTYRPEDDDFIELYLQPKAGDKHA